MSDNSSAPIGHATMVGWLLVEEISHRVTNEYTAAIGSISLAAARCANADARAVLAGAARRLLDHADVHRALRPPSVAGLADLGQYLRGLCGAIVRASLADRKIHLTLLEETIEIEAEECWRVGMIVFELITNAARHGLRHGGGGIVVALSARDERVRCLVKDDGVSTNPTAGRGTLITRALARDLGGGIDWHFGPDGTKALLCFPRGRRSVSIAA